MLVKVLFRLEMLSSLALRTFGLKKVATFHHLFLRSIPGEEVIKNKKKDRLILRDFNFFFQRFLGPTRCSRPRCPVSRNAPVRRVGMRTDHRRHLHTQPDQRCQASSPQRPLRSGNLSCCPADR